MHVQQDAIDGVGHVGQRWSATPTGDRGVEIVAELGRVAVGVRLSAAGMSWSHDEVIAVDPDAASVESTAEALDDALDLVATGLWGGARLLVRRAGGRAVGMTVGFGGGGAYSHFAAVPGPRQSLVQRLSSLWTQEETTVHRNDVPPPADVTRGAVGRVPTAPWSGVLSAVATDDVPTVVPVDGVLDLHTFKPKQVAPAVREYIQACKDKGITELRIIHGKGIGNLRRTVHSLLSKHDDVAEYKLGGSGGGSWGATVVTLKPES